MRRALILLALCLAFPASVAAQSNPFGPLPQPAAPTATPEPLQDPNDDGVDSKVLFGIAGIVLLLFVGIGLYISRDAREHLTDHDRRSLERRDGESVEAQRLRSEHVRKKARAKTKAQKQARKKQRSR